MSEIIQHPNKILRNNSVEIIDFTEAANISKRLQKALTKSSVPGAGISAPQIGINKRIFIARKFFITKDNKEEHRNIIFINPTLLYASKKMQKSLEGCLSIYNTYGHVMRHKSIKMGYYDVLGKPRTLKAGGFFSTVIQHEIDHLNGVLFIDKLVDNKTYTESEVDAMFSEKK